MSCQFLMKATWSIFALRSLGNWPWICLKYFWWAQHLARVGRCLGSTMEAPQSVCPSHHQRERPLMHLEQQETRSVGPAKEVKMSKENQRNLRRSRIDLCSRCNMHFNNWVFY
jgi:hypothetical protein